MSQHSLKKFDTPLLLDIGISRYYQYGLAGLGLLSALAIVLLNIDSLMIKLLLFLSCMIYLTTAYFRHKPLRLSLLANDQWQLESGQSSSLTQLNHNSVITPFFCLLQFTHKDRSSSRVLLFRDNVDSDAFRRFRVWVRVKGIDLSSRDTLGG